MDKDGLWELFFATGLPEAYLALQSEKDPLRTEEAVPAFHSAGERLEQG